MLIQLTNIHSQNNIEKPTNTGAVNISATTRTRTALQTITDGVDEFSIIPALFFNYFFKNIIKELCAIFLFIYMDLPCAFYPTCTKYSIIK